MSTWPEYLAARTYGDWCHTHSGHEAYVCTEQHEDGGQTCMFCAGGLFACVRCGAFEGATPSECPGIKMTPDQSDRVYACIIDYRFGQWVAGGTIVMMHVWASPPELPFGYSWDWDQIENYLSTQEYEPTVVNAL